MALVIGAGVTISGGITILADAAPAGYATGGTIYDITGYRVHVFNSSDTFATTASWPSGRTIEYVVVAGGGGGVTSSSAYNGGGGAGGLLSTTGSTRPVNSAGSTPSGVTATASTNYAVTIGGGGSLSSNGANSSIVGGAISATSIGGGAGGSGETGSAGAAGGSGGGGGNGGIGGAGTAGQGNDGGVGSGEKSSAGAGAGGGAGAVGGENSTRGGAGLVSTLLTTTSDSEQTINDFDTYTFTVAAGLWFQTYQAVIVSQTSDISNYAFGVVVSYVGTTLVCRLRAATVPGTFSDWTISLVMAGGGPGAQEGESPLASAGGGAGCLGNGGNFMQDASPNSGAGGGDITYASPQSPYPPGYTYTGAGGSGVVMIKYAYP